MSLGCVRAAARGRVPQWWRRTGQWRLLGASTANPPTARSLWTWGNADHGKGGTGLHPDAPIFAHQQFTPAKVKESDLPAKFIQQVTCGGAHTLLVTASGRLLTCGLGEQGQLGYGPPAPRCPATMVGARKCRDLEYRALCASVSPMCPVQARLAGEQGRL